MSKMITSISNKIINFFFILFIIIFSLSSILTTHYLDIVEHGIYKIIYEIGFNIPYFILLVGLLVIIVIANKKDFFGLKEKHLLIIDLVILSICGAILIYLHNGVYLQSDSGNVMDAATRLANGDYSVLDFKSYMNANPNNFGLFTIDYILIKIFKDFTIVTIVFRIFNLIFACLLYIYLYRIAKLLFNSRSVNMNLLLLYLGFNQLLFSAVFVYGNVISYSLSVISIYYLLKYFSSGKIINIVISTITIMLSIFVRKNSLIILIAEVIYIILYVIKSKKYLTLISLPIIAGLLFATTTGVEKYYGSLVNYDYSKTAMPTITWVAYGLNYDKTTPGRWFDEYDRIHVANNFETDLIKVEAKQFIDSALDAFVHDPKLCLEFFATKFSSSWCDPRYDAFTQSHNTSCALLKKEPFQNAMTCYWDAWLTIASVGLLLLLITKFKFKLEYMLPAVCVIGGFLFHFFWEVKAVYCYQYVLFALPYAALGLSKIKELLFTKS